LATVTEREAVAMTEPEKAEGRVLVGPDGRALRGTFPRHWGRPPDDLDERQEWMRRNIREGEERMNRGEKVEGQRPKTGRQALASLRRRSVSPEVIYQINRLRLRLLDLRREGPL
jgi:hypothetical protein